MNWTGITRLNKNESRWTLNLPGAGCTWAKKTDGCYMCNFKSATDKYTRGKLLPAGVFTGLLGIAYLLVKRKKPDSLIIFNGGSFCNNDEIPIKAQRKILEFVAKKKSIKKVIIESRPEYITKKKLKELSDVLERKKLIIAIGLETKSDKIRRRCINKGFSLNNYDKAVSLMKQNSVGLLTYVLLKPMYLSESEAVGEAIATIKYAFEAGSDEVHLESACVVEGTKLEHLYNEGSYVPPKVSSIIEVVKTTHGLGNLYLGGFDDNPKPIATPMTHEKHYKDFEMIMDEYNREKKLSVFDNA